MNTKLKTPKMRILHPASSLLDFRLRYSSANNNDGALPIAMTIIVDSKGWRLAAEVSIVS